MDSYDHDGLMKLAIACSLDQEKSGTAEIRTASDAPIRNSSGSMSPFQSSSSSIEIGVLFLLHVLTRIENEIPNLLLPSEMPFASVCPEKLPVSASEKLSSMSWLVFLIIRLFWICFAPSDPSVIIRSANAVQVVKLLNRIFLRPQPLAEPASQVLQNTTPSSRAYPANGTFLALFVLKTVLLAPLSESSNNRESADEICTQSEITVNVAVIITVIIIIIVIIILIFCP
jgi:hypothetical protein